MGEQYLFNFKAEISQIDIPKKMNNPFEEIIPIVAKIAAKEFQDFIELESQKWGHDFLTQKGKMFGVLVVQNKDNSYNYLGTVSGKLPGNASCDHFVPTVFDDTTDNYFINRGMTALTEIGNQINTSKDPDLIRELTERRKQKSIGLQQQLFENYLFQNHSGIEKNILQIFENSSHGNPPSAAGECAAPKLLQHAFKYQLKPIALAEFWWGSSIQNKEKKHQVFYPACKNKCRPILEFMLEDCSLFDQANGK